MRRVAVLLGALVAACSLSVGLPEGVAREIAVDTLAVAHPTATFRGARLLGGSTGACSGSRHVDVAIDYTALLGEGVHTMKVQYLVTSLDPCRVEPVVIEDTGPVPPVLLKSTTIARAVGELICEQLR